MDNPEKRKELLFEIQEIHSSLGRINNVLDEYIILCDKCSNRDLCYFAYSIPAVKLKEFFNVSGKNGVVFSEQECSFFCKNPRYEPMKYSGKKVKK